jgi:YfiH family protein
VHKANNLDALAGVDHGFCTIDDPLRPDEVFICKQVHSATTIEWHPELTPNTVEADGVFSRDVQPIAVITADCLPLLMASESGDFVAAIHGGWKGLQGGIIANAMQRFAAEGVALDQLRIAIGPSIKPCCYEVSGEFVAQLQASQGHLWRDGNAPWTFEQPAPLVAPEIQPPEPRQALSAWFDLGRYALILLEAAGIKPEQVEVSEVCTYCTSPAFASYRRRTHDSTERKTLLYSWISRKTQR